MEPTRLSGLSEKDQKKQVGRVRCSVCNRGMSAASKWVEGQDEIFCEACYQQLLFSNLPK